MNNIFKVITKNNFNSFSSITAASSFKRSLAWCSLFQKPNFVISSVEQPKESLLAQNNNNSTNIQSVRTGYTFKFATQKLHKNQHATRPKRTTDQSLLLTYEQSQFAEKLGVTKSWNTWNTSNLLESKRQAETVRDDVYIRKFLYGTFHDLFVSEIVIKRHLNTVNCGFLIRQPRPNENTQIYFLVGYAEELLSCLFKCNFKIELQTVRNRQEVAFRTW